MLAMFSISLIKDIFDGYWNLLFSKGERRTKASKRFTVCKSCQLLQIGLCSECGCYMRAKVFVEHAKCEHPVKDQWNETSEMQEV